MAAASDNRTAPQPALSMPSTHHLFLRIMAAVVQSPNSMTVADIGKALDIDEPALIARASASTSMRSASRWRRCCCRRPASIGYQAYRT